MSNRRQPPGEPAGLDESTITANLERILKKIARAADRDPAIISKSGTVQTHPAILRPDYWMGKMSFDPQHVDQRSINGRHRMQASRFLELLGYYSIFPGPSIATLPGGPAYAQTVAYIKNDWRLRAKKVSRLWQAVRALLFDPQTFKLIENFFQTGFPVNEFQSLCSTWIREVVEEMMDPQDGQKLHPKGKAWMGLPKDKMFPATNRPDLETFAHMFTSSEPHNIQYEKENDDLFRCMYPDMPTELRRPVYADREVPVEDEEKPPKLKSKTLTLETQANVWAPILNAQNLAQPGFLVSFLYHRANNHPSYFASRDFEASYVGRAGRMDDFFCVAWTRCFWEFSDDAEYMHHVEWPSDGDEASKAAVKSAEEKGRLYTHFEAAAVLHSQTLIYGFIFKLLAHLRRDIPDGLIRPENPRRTINATDFSNLMEHIENNVRSLEANDLQNVLNQSSSGSYKDIHLHWLKVNQYAAPDGTVVDFDVWETRLRSLRDAARERLRKLMRDPNEFLAEAKVAMDHHVGQIQALIIRLPTFHFLEGKRRSSLVAKALVDLAEDELSSSVLHRVVYVAVRDVEIWEHLHTLTDLVRKEAVSSCVDLGSIDVPLTGKLHKLWLLLLHSIRASFKHYYADFQINSIFMSSPLTRKWFRRKYKAPYSQALLQHDEENIYEALSIARPHGWEKLLKSKPTEKKRQELMRLMGINPLLKDDDNDLVCKDNSFTCYRMCAAEPFIGDSVPKVRIEDTAHDEVNWEHLPTEEKMRIIKTKLGVLEKHPPNFPENCNILSEFVPRAGRLSYVGMTGLGQIIATAEERATDRTLTPHVQDMLTNLMTLSYFTDDLERTRRIPFPQAMRLQQEFEEQWGALGKYALGPSTVLSRLATYQFIPESFRKRCGILKSLLYPLLQSIENDAPPDGQGGLRFEWSGWDEVLPPANRKKHLEAVWLNVLSGIFRSTARSTSDFAREASVKILTKAVNQGQVGLGLAKFLVSLAADDERGEMMGEEDEALGREIVQLIAKNQAGDTEEDEDDVDQDVEMKDFPDDTTSVPETKSPSKSPSPKKPARQRPRDSAFMKRRRQQEAKRRGQLGLLPAAGEPAAVTERRRRLATAHWNTFAALFGKNATVSFHEIRQAMGAIGFAIVPGAVGSAWQFRWTEASMLPTPLDRLSIAVHDFHGAAERNARVAGLRIGNRLITELGVTKRKLERFYEGGPSGGWM